jgi:CRP/FNR family transcriptional regulator, anaerobic regulatory protein
MSVFTLIEKNIRNFISLNKDEEIKFLNRLTIKKLKRKELLLREGEVCRHAYFINTGCIRYFYTIEGEQHTMQFFFENGWYTDYESFLSGSPSRQNIEALEKCELLMLSREDLNQLYVEVPKFERFGRLVAENAFLGLHKRNIMLSNFKPEERYLQLLQERPKVMERIPQHYIASYLGIKPESLSRIRKRIVSQ